MVAARAVSHPLAREPKEVDPSDIDLPVRHIVSHVFWLGRSVRSPLISPS
jgi:hypothetical protein